MTALMRVELRKLRTTPMLYVALGLTVALTVISVVTTLLLAGHQGTAAIGSKANVVKVLNVGSVSSMVMLIVGILVIGGEHRYRTIIGTYLAEPRRGRILVAKLLVTGVLGMLVGAGTFGLALAIALPVYASRGVHHLPVDVSAMWLGTALASACYAMLGVALGSVTRNTVAAVIGALIWVQLVEVALLQPLIPSIAKWLPTGAGVALTGQGNDLLPPALAAVVLIAWAVALAFTAAQFSLRREVL
jgi:ABC-2 type transport system permease protein